MTTRRPAATLPCVTRLTFVMVLLAACSDAPAPAADAGLDEPTGVMGTWAITWTCVAGCTIGAINPLAYNDVLVVAPDGTATYQSTTCADCGAVHAMTATASCLTVAAGEDFGVVREAYEACATGGVLAAELTWSGYPGPFEPRTYRLRGTPGQP